MYININRNPNLLDLPIEIVYHHIASYFDSKTLESFRNVCKCFRNMSSNIEKRLEEMRMRKIQEGKDRFIKKREKWRKIRDELSSSEKEELDKKLRGKVKHCDLSSVQDITDLYEKGASGEEIPVYELAGYETHAEFSYNIFEFNYTKAESVRNHLRLIKVQLDAQVPITCKRYLGNGGSSPEGFFGYSIGGNILKTRKKGIEYDEYYEAMIDTLRYYRDAGAELNKCEQLQGFLRDVRWHLSEVKGRKGKAEIREAQERIIQFLKFLIDENGSDILETYKYHEDDLFLKGGIVEMFKSEDCHFLIPIFINPYKILRNKEKTEKFVRGFCSYLWQSERVKFSNSKSSRKMIKKFFSGDELRSKIIELDKENYFGTFCLDLVYKKERRILKYFLSKKDLKKYMLEFRTLESDKIMKRKNRLEKVVGDTLLHAICGVRGKTERILKLFIENGFDVNVRNGNGSTPIMKSIEINHFECIVILIENGADLDLKCDDRTSGRERLKEKSWLLEKIEKKNRVYQPFRKRE